MYTVVIFQDNNKGILSVIKNTAIFQTWLPSFLYLSSTRIFLPRGFGPCCIIFPETSCPSLVMVGPFHPWAILSNVTASEGPSQKQPLLQPQILAITLPSFILVMEFTNSEITLFTFLFVYCFPTLELKFHQAATLLSCLLQHPESLEQRFSKCGLWTLCKGLVKSKFFFIIILRLYLIFSPCWHLYRRWVKWLTPWHESRTWHQLYQQSFHYTSLCTYSKKKNPPSLKSHLRMSFKKQSKLLKLFILFSLNLWVHNLSVFCINKIGSTHKSLCYTPKCIQWFSQGKTLPWLNCELE